MHALEMVTNRRTGAMLGTIVPNLLATAGRCGTELAPGASLRPGCTV